MQDKIKEVIIWNLETYLKSYLERLPEDKHEIARQSFLKDMERIVQYCVWNFDNLISEEFIKWLHKTLYPEWYMQKSKDKFGREFIWMIPWEYRKIDISAKENRNKNIYQKPENVWESMKKLINDFNKSMSKDLDLKSRLDKILFFAIDFVQIHPFWDGNWRLDGLLIDLICIKYDIKPLNLLKIYKENKNTFIFALESSRKTRNLKYLYEFIEK